MKFKLHFIYQDDSEDSMILSGEPEELLKQASIEVNKRNPKNYWPTTLDDNDKY